MKAPKKKAGMRQGRLGPHWKSRIVGHAKVDPRSLKPNPMNWRVHPPAQTRQMRDALDRLGVIAGVVVNKRTGFILDGHMRHDLALENDEPTVDVTFVDLSPDEERLALSIMNPMGELGATDPEKLGALLGAIEREGGPLDELLRDLETQASGSIVKEIDAKNGGAGRHLGNRAHVMRMMLENPDVAVVERAIAITGLLNRGDALLAICRAYLGSKTDDTERQHDTEPQGSLEDQLAQALAEPARGARNARRPRPRIRAGVPDGGEGDRVRGGPDESGGALPSAAELERVSGES